MAAAAAAPALVVDPFCLRQFDPKSGKTPYISCEVANFEVHVNKLWEASEPGSLLRDGYAPFCKHIFIPNFVGASVNVLPITPENEAMLKSGALRAARQNVRASILGFSRWRREYLMAVHAWPCCAGYSARTEKELAVLSRWFPKGKRMQPGPCAAA
jgi:hypothetical protein